MNLHSKLKELQLIKDNIRKEYSQIAELEKDIVKEMVETDNKEINLNNNQQATLVWAVEKHIDYDKLTALYPIVYRLGLKPTFSKTQALNSVSPSLLNKILNDCITKKSKYKLKVRRKKNAT